MRSFVLAMVLGLGLGLVACGGKEKPPLTPDQDNPALDAGIEPAATPPVTSATAPASPAKK